MAEQHRQLDGIVAVPATPFTEDDRVDVDSLHRYVRHVIAHGAVGFLAPAVASEVEPRPEAERELIVATLPEPYTKVAFLADEEEKFLHARRDGQPFILHVNSLEPHPPTYGTLNELHDPALVPAGPAFARPPGPQVAGLVRRQLQVYERSGYKNHPIATETDWRRLRANYYGLVSMVDNAYARILHEPDDPDPARHYKMAVYGRYYPTPEGREAARMEAGNVPSSIYPFFSADGLTWTLATPAPKSGDAFDETEIPFPVRNNFEIGGLYKFDGIYYVVGHLNVDGVSHTAALRVELIDKLGEPLAGYSGADAAIVAESGLKVPVQWTNGARIDCVNKSYRVRVTFAGPDATGIKFYAAYLE